MKTAKQYKKILFIHRRDLRVQDNIGLNHALLHSVEVLPCFIFDPIQIDKTNAYRSDRQIIFMKESLLDLASQYQKIKGELHTFLGAPEKIVESLIKKEGIEAVYVNSDYTPYSKARDTLIQSVCEKLHVAFVPHHDLLLIGNPENIKNSSGKPFTIFTPFWKKAELIKVVAPVKVKSGAFVAGKLSVATTEIQQALSHTQLEKQESSNAIRGGRVDARAILKGIHRFHDYTKNHNIPDLPLTKLSAHIKFGTVSIREIFYALGTTLDFHHPLIRQLYWRDFYTYIVYHFPQVIGNSFDVKHNVIFWNKDYVGLDAWKTGMTGIPIVDAGMRELNTTGYMHNRVRLITGSFLTKDLHIGWWIGERYFAQKLVDYDISVNNGNWQWVGGTGVDPVPYFRIFNPWLQAKKFDPDALYIKKWVPELASLSAKEIHKLFKNTAPAGIDYPKPMVDHTEEMRKVKGKYVKN